MAPDAIVYEKSIQHLEGDVSYGTLGIINKLVQLSNKPPLWDLYLINIGTVVRNCLDRDKSLDQIRKQVELDMLSLLQYISIYGGSDAHMVVIYLANQRLSIPPEHRRTATATRKKIEDITNKIISYYKYPTGKLFPVDHSFDESMKVYAYHKGLKSPFRYLSELLRYQVSFNKAALLSSNSIDFLLLNVFKNIDIMSSHTGNILTSKDLSQKVFKVPDIPFHESALKLFGDTDNIVPIIRNKPKVLSRLKGINLHRKSEREFLSIMKSKCKIDPKALTYNL